METETKQLSPVMTFAMYMLLLVLSLTSIVVLIVYFSGLYKADYTRGERMMIGFGIGLLISVVLAGLGTWRATREPTEEDEEGAEDEEEVEDEEE
jgi:hypothetical protein